MSRRILWASDSPRFHTGYGTIGQALVPRWAQNHEVGVVGWYAPRSSSAAEAEKWAFFPGGDWDSLCLAKILEQFQPEILITTGNLSMLSAVPEALGNWKGWWIGYFPVEGSPIPSRWLPLLESMARVVTFTRYGQAALYQLGLKKPVACIPLGVDADLFRPLPDRRKVRAEWGLADRFVVGCVARNQPRKQFPILLRAFARFAQDCAEAFLYLHTDPDDQGWDLIELSRHYGVADRLGFTAGLAYVLGVSTSELNEIYNLFDVFVLPSMAEGFGLPILEAMAAGVPVVTTDYAAGAELARGRGRLIRVAQWITGAEHDTDLALADEDHLVEILKHLYASSEEREQLAQKGRVYAEEWTWDRCHAAWESLLEELPRLPQYCQHRPVRSLTVQGSDDLESVYLVAESVLIALQEKYPKADLTLQTRASHHRLVELCARQFKINLTVVEDPREGDRREPSSKSCDLKTAQTKKKKKANKYIVPPASLWRSEHSNGLLTRRPQRLHLPIEEQAAAMAFLQNRGRRPGEILVGVVSSPENPPPFSAIESWFDRLQQSFPQDILRIVSNIYGITPLRNMDAIDLAMAGDSLAQVAVLERCQILISWEGWGSAIGNALGVPLMIATSRLPLPVPVSPALSDFVILHGGKTEGGKGESEIYGPMIGQAARELMAPPTTRYTVWRPRSRQIPRGQERLSIIVLTCNHSPEQLASTQRCLKAVRNYTTHPFELIVVDNGSDNETVDWLRQQTDIQLHLLFENRGIIAGRNWGASQARFEYLVFLDNDQYVRPGWDEELLHLLRGPVALAGVEQWRFHPNGIVRPSWQRDGLTYIGAGGMVIEREVFKELGGFDEAFNPAYGEDPDLCWRAQERGYEFAWCRKALIDHVGHLTLGQTMELLMAHLQQLRIRWSARFDAMESG